MNGYSHAVKVILESVEFWQFPFHDRRSQLIFFICWEVLIFPVNAVFKYIFQPKADTVSRLVIKNMFLQGLVQRHITEGCTVAVLHVSNHLFDEVAVRSIYRE